MMSPEEVRSLAEKMIKKGMGMGFTECEVFFECGRTYQAGVEKGELSTGKMNVNCGIGFRGLLGKSLGFTHTNTLNEKSLLQIVEDAYRIAKANKPNEQWISLPTTSNPATIEKMVDKTVVDAESSLAVDLMSRLVEYVRNYDKRVKPVFGFSTLSYGFYGVVNSWGVDCVEKATAVHMGVGCVAKEDNRVGSFSWMGNSSRLLDIDVRKIAEESARMALDSLKTRKVESFKGSLILDVDAIETTILAPLMDAVNGDWVRLNRSPLRDKLNEEVLDEEITIYDDSLIEGGVGSSGFDGEGFRTQRTCLFEKGVLKSFLHTSFTANILKMENTGNAVRSYSSLPSVGNSNIVVSPGNFGDLISEVRRGIFFRRFSGHHIGERGDVSGVAKQAYYVENGEIKFPLTDVNINFNIYRVLREQFMGLEKKVRRYGELFAPRLGLEGIDFHL